VARDNICNVRADPAHRYCDAVRFDMDGKTTQRLEKRELICHTAGADSLTGRNFAT